MEIYKIPQLLILLYFEIVIVNMCKVFDKIHISYSPLCRYIYS